MLMVLPPQNVINIAIAKSKYDNGNNNDERAAEGIPKNCMNLRIAELGEESG
jgi:hypothetical protein